jgi:casein kinase II subunit alpha
LVKISKVVGTEEILKYMSKYDLELNDDIVLEQYEKKSLSSFINEKNRSRISDEAIDLLDRML